MFDPLLMQDDQVRHYVSIHRSNPAVPAILSETPPTARTDGRTDGFPALPYTS